MAVDPTQPMRDGRSIHTDRKGVGRPDGADEAASRVDAVGRDGRQRQG